jgi:hypothetical protein
MQNQSTYGASESFCSRCWLAVSGQFYCASLNCSEFESRHAVGRTHGPKSRIHCLRHWRDIFSVSLDSHRAGRVEYVHGELFLRVDAACVHALSRFDLWDARDKSGRAANPVRHSSASLVQQVVLDPFAPATMGKLRALYKGLVSSHAAAWLS